MPVHPEGAPRKKPLPAWLLPGVIALVLFGVTAFAPVFGWEWDLGMVGVAAQITAESNLPQGFSHTRTGHSGIWALRVGTWHWGFSVPE